MMGQQVTDQNALFYDFCLENFVPHDHLLRKIDALLDLSELRAHLAPYYSHTGRRSIDPEVLIRMLVVGYCYGILISGEDVNLEQVESGMAWHYKKYQGEQTPTDRVKYSDAELEARRIKLGLWQDPNSVSPWEYRQAKRDHMNDLESFVGKSTVRGSQ